MSSRDVRIVCLRLKATRCCDVRAMLSPRATDTHRHFAGAQYFTELLDHEDGGSTLCRNLGDYPPVDTT
jgi:hypothetical protein